MLCRIINFKTIITLLAFFSVINTFAYNICEVCKNKQIPDGKRCVNHVKANKQPQVSSFFMGMMNLFSG